ncbi:hypothetical protein M899_1741 [Bacteriovorax sp. BSW11_IV]|uniref:hypothetical protein n=1 Tax=Bacteriovorax sp. BSW11_IV TaxID=1353529 RepID=UPI000389DE72|nr:hypothetical protein [Bacteriovorax sp. BSW11_IV]EQC49422.1 hypothetical protein M899_1741 [Bacteriovorax sp. BSW11_IV]
METLATFDEAVELLKNAVKYSTIENQKHLDLSVINAPDRLEYQKALMVVQSAVKRGEITQDELKQRLGLI